MHLYHRTWGGCKPLRYLLVCGCERESAQSHERPLHKQRDAQSVKRSSAGLGPPRVLQGSGLRTSPICAMMVTTRSGRIATRRMLTL